MSAEDNRSALWVSIWFCFGIVLGIASALDCVVWSPSCVTSRKSECFQQAFALNTLAWNNMTRLWFYLVGF